MMVDIDIEKIMDEIRTEIKEKGFTTNDLDFEAIPLNAEIGSDNELKEILELLKKNEEINYYQNLDGNKIKVFIKKIIRKLIKPIVKDLCMAQTRFNVTARDSLEHMYLCIIDQEKRIRELEKKVEEGKKKA